MRTPSLRSCQLCSMAWSWQQWQQCSTSSSAAWTSRAPPPRRTSPTRIHPYTGSFSSPVLSWPKSKCLSPVHYHGNVGQLQLRDAVCLVLGHLLSVFLGVRHICTRNVRLQRRHQGIVLDLCFINTVSLTRQVYFKWTSFLQGISFVQYHLNLEFVLIIRDASRRVRRITSLK